MFVCNEDILYCDKDEIIDFIDEHKAKLQGNNKYQCVIVHILSHGVDEGTAFVTSDKRKINVEDMIHELTEYADNNGELIKITFNHSCRGTANYEDGTTVRGPTNYQLMDDDDEKDHEHVESSELANRVIIWANVKGRVVSDLGHFTNWICDAFENNMDKWWPRKSYFRSLCLIDNFLRSASNIKCTMPSSSASPSQILSLP